MSFEKLIIDVPWDMQDLEFVVFMAVPSTTSPKLYWILVYYLRANKFELETSRVSPRT